MQLLADVEQALLHEMRDEAGVGAVLDDGRRALVLPLRRHAAEVHVAPVERLFRRVRSGRVAYGSQSSVDVLMYSTPWSWHHCRISQRVDVPGEVDQDVAVADVLLRAACPCCPRSPGRARSGRPWRSTCLSFAALVLEIHDRDVLRRHLDVLEEDRQGALGDRAVADKEDLVFEWDHGTSWKRDGKSEVCSCGKRRPLTSVFPARPRPRRPCGQSG